MLALLIAAGCSHSLRGAPLSEPAKRLGAEAKGLRPIEFEEDYIDARLLYREGSKSTDIGFRVSYTP